MTAVARSASWTANWTASQQLVALSLALIAAGIAYLACIALIRTSASNTQAVLWIAIVGLLMRLVTCAQPPAFETDYNRFLWDGAVAAHGVSPYAYRPQDIVDGQATRFAVEPRLIALREAGLQTLQRINHPYLTTIYPPVTQAFFTAAYWISPFDPNALRGLLLAAESLIVILLAFALHRLRQPLTWIAIYWWNPIAIKEFYLGVHVDAFVALLAVASVCAAAWNRRWLSVGLLSLAIAAKLWPVVLAPLVLRYGRRSTTDVLARGAALVIASCALSWPLLGTWGHEGVSGLSAYSAQWVNNAGFYAVIDHFDGWIRGMLSMPGIHAKSASRHVVGALFVAWMIVLSTRRLRDPQSLFRWSMFAVAVTFLISPTQFPWYYTWLLPFLALAPVKPMLLYAATLPLYHLQWDQPWVLWVEHLPVWLLIAWAGLRSVSSRRVVESADDAYTPPHGWRIVTVIPALNEERAIGKVIANIPSWVAQVIVVDNGSTDATAGIARAAGATVIAEPRRGYGAACLAGISAADRPDVIVFLDGDYSDVPSEMSRLVKPIILNEADLVIGSRVLGQAEAGSLTIQQRFGNSLACMLMRWIYGVRYSDLGPFRAVHAGALQRLAMDDRDYGWTVQMQVRAARHGLRGMEVPVGYRRRIGVSKISGTVRGVLAAGTKILSTIFREGARRHRPREQATERVIVMARYPEAGKAKTRLIPLLGPDGAALLHRQLVTHTLSTVEMLACRRSVHFDVCFTGGSSIDMATMFGRQHVYRSQSTGDLGDRLYAAAAEAFGSGLTKVILIGTDCPLLTSETLSEALDALDHHDVVLGPAVDGGYYLIGMRSLYKPIFEGIAWGGPTVLAETIEACRRIGARFALLTELSDVDVPADLAAWGHARLAQAEDQPALSIVIPARNEATHLAATIASALAARNVHIVVVDAQSVDKTREIACAFGVEVITSIPSRGVQLNAGAAVARAEGLLFLHADTRLPSLYDVTVRRMLSRPGLAAGAFDLAIDAGGWAPRMIEAGVRLRSRWLGRPYGDQACFMARRVYDQCNGYPAIPFMEDYAMLARLHNVGRIDISEQAVLTASRRWTRHGWWATTLRHQWLIIRYLLGYGPRA
jgi:hypothetical protein